MMEEHRLEITKKKRKHATLKRLFCFISPRYSKKIQESQRFEYMMLDRLRCDCEYYLGWGNRYPGHLWAENETMHIIEMKKLYKLLVVKPEWISMKDIKRYERAMLASQASSQAYITEILYG